jgi:flagellin-like hook-associated protein FlgL
MSVRISSNQVLDAGTQAMDNSLVDATAWQKKISSGKQYSKVSDNAYAVTRGVRLDFDIGRLQMYKANQNFLTSSHAVAQAQMSSIIDELNSLKQTFTQSQNGALNTSNFGALKIQAQQIRDTIKSQMIAKDATGNPIFADTVNQVQIEPNVMVDSGVKFTDAFGAGGTFSTPENSQLYDSINKFVTYLDEKSRGVATTQTAGSVESGLDTAFDQITMAEQISGGISAQVDASKTAMSAFGVEFASSQSTLLDTDMAEATAAYTRAQTLLNAAQAMFAKLQSSNLFSKL